MQTDSQTDRDREREREREEKLIKLLLTRPESTIKILCNCTKMDRIYATPGYLQ